MKLSSSSSPLAIQPVQHSSPYQSNVGGNAVAGLFVIILPTCLALGAFLGRKYYCAYRAKVLLKQIEMLERLWHISSRR